MNDDILYDVTLKLVMLEKQLDNLLRVIDAMVDALPQAQAEEIRKRMLLPMSCDIIEDRKRFERMKRTDTY